jgi:hypothetical protein
MHDGLNSLLHVLHAHPFQPRVEGVFAGKDVRAGQPLGDSCFDLFPFVAYKSRLLARDESSNRLSIAKPLSLNGKLLKASM